MDKKTGAVDYTATTAACLAERELHKARGKPYHEFVKKWETEAPPAAVLFYGSWKDRSVIYRGSPDDTCPADAIVPIVMPNPKDLRIAQLEAELDALRGAQA